MGLITGLNMVIAVITGTLGVVVATAGGKDSALATDKIDFF